MYNSQQRQLRQRVEPARVESSPTTSGAPSTPASPILGVVTEEADEPLPEEQTPATTLAISSATRGKQAGSEQGASTRLRVVGLSTLPAAIRESLTTDLIDDPLLAPEKLKVLQDNLKSCYKITTVSNLPSALSDCYCLVLCLMNVMCLDSGDGKSLISEVSEAESCSGC